MNNKIDIDKREILDAVAILRAHMCEFCYYELQQMLTCCSDCNRNNSFINFCFTCENVAFDCDCRVYDSE